MSAWTMSMRLLVGAYGELRDVAVQRTLREIETDMAAPGAAFLCLNQR